MPDIFDEIDEDLRAERMRAFARRYTWLLLALIVLVVGGVGGYEFWRYREAQTTAAVATEFAAALREPTSATFEMLAATAPGGYRTLAQLRLAALKADSGDLPGALALWNAVARDADADADMRGLANLLWAERQVDTGDPAAIAARLDPLADSNNTWHALAQEAQALLALKRGDPARTREILAHLVTDATAPDDLRQRAALMLALPGIQAPRE